MKVYLATSGEYSDYRIDRVFARRQDAEAYGPSERVEEYELHEGPVEWRTWHILRWRPLLPDQEYIPYKQDANPQEISFAVDHDGSERQTTYKWADDFSILDVTGWDREEVLKVYSEQRAQYIANRDAGTAP